MNYLKIFLFTTPIFLLVDMIWLGLVAKGFYQKYLGFLMGTINFVPVILFYFIYVFGLVVLVVVPALQIHSIWRAILFGALFGLRAYAAYDFTNQATVKDWPWIVTVVDLLWGTFVSGLMAFISYFLANKFL